MAYIQSAADIALNAQSYFNNNGDVVMYLVISKGTLFGLFPSIQKAAEFVQSQQDKIKKEKVGYIIPIYMDNESVWTNVNKNYKFDTVKTKMNTIITNVNNGVNVSQRFGYIELMIAYLMQHPEIIARHPNMRKIMDMKVKDAINHIKTNNKLPKSVTILYDYKRFIKAIKSRTDYIDDVVKHRYYLRSMAKKNGGYMKSKC